MWIDQDLCTGDGLCVDHCPDVFRQLEDGIAYVKEGGRTLNDPGGCGSLARVPNRHIQQAIHAAERCPGECIFIEIERGHGRLPGICTTAIVTIPRPSGTGSTPSEYLVSSEYAVRV